MGGVNVAQDEAFAKFLHRMRGDKESELNAKYKNLTRAQLAELMAADDADKAKREAQRQDDERRKRVQDEEQKRIDKEQMEKDAVKKERERQEMERLKEAKKKEKKEADRLAKLAEKAAKDRAAKSASPTPSPSSSPPPTLPTPAPASTPPPAEPVKPAEESKEKGASVSAPPGAAKVLTGSDEWSADEQASLERALKSIGKEREDRWEAIAALVGSKSKKQCVSRFKHIRESILKQKGDAK